MPVIVVYLFIRPGASFDRYKEAGHCQSVKVVLVAL